MSVLVDTSVWVDFLRGRSAAHVDALRALLGSEESVLTAPPILQEILQGATTRDRQKALRREFQSIACVSPADPVASSVEAARLFLECRINGQTPRSSNDCLIAGIAMEHGLALLHHDRDFEAIARVAPRLRMYRYAGGEA
jgi:hypothetical protein